MTINLQYYLQRYTLHYLHYLQHSTILRFLSLLHTQNERKKEKEREELLSILSLRHSLSTIHCFVWLFYFSLSNTDRLGAIAVHRCHCLYSLLLIGFMGKKVCRIWK